MKYDEGISQGSYMKDPWTWISGFILTMEGGWAGWREAKGDTTGIIAKHKKN